LKHALATAADVGFGRQGGRAAVFQKCAKSLWNWVERGCCLSESRIPEWM
jgi:hypothetical protein